MASIITKYISNHFTIETEQEVDGRWIAEILEISGAFVYGNSQQQAIANVQALALRVIADKNEIKMAFMRLLVNFIKNFAGTANKLGTVFRYHRHQIKVKC